MTQSDDQDTAPGRGDPTRSDDHDAEGLRSGMAGRGAERAVAGPAPTAGDATEVRADPDFGRTGVQDGPLGSAGGGYGSSAAQATAGGSPDGEDVQKQSGPGPQTDWLRGATGKGDRHPGTDPA
jgi:hypothetical protein